MIFELKELPKTKPHPITCQEKFHNILQHHPDQLYVIMGGSKDNDKTACAAVLNKTIIKKALPMESSIFIVEARAIDLALDIISKSKHKKFIIFSVSLSVLLSLKNKKIESPLIIKLLGRLGLMSNSKRIIICWIPSHIKVRGNERAHSATKQVLHLTPDKFRIPNIDLKPSINKFLHAKWQQRWNNNIHNKPFQIQPTLGEWRPGLRKSRKEQVIISQLRIGHTRLTHSFILKQEPQPQCLTCQTSCTIKHLLIECRAFTFIRKRFFKVNSLINLFENVKIDEVLFFLWDTGLYQKIWWIETS